MGGHAAGGRPAVRPRALIAAVAPLREHRAWRRQPRRLTPTNGDDDATRTVRVRTEVAAVAKTFDYAVPDGLGRRRSRVGTRVRAPLHGRTRAGLGGRRRRRRGRRTSTSCPSSRGWAGDHRRPWSSWPTGRPGAGPVRPPSSSAPPRRERSCGRCPRAAVSAADRPGDARPGHPWRGRIGGGHGDGAFGFLRPPISLDLVLSTLTEIRRAAGAGSVLVLVPSAGWAERLAERLVRRGWPATHRLGRGAGRLARRGGEPGRRLGAGAPAGGRRGARCARRRLPRRERPDLQRGRCGARAGAARGCALPPGLTGARRWR